MSICSIEDVAANVEKPFWFQLYVMKDRGFIKALIERAIAAKCSALVLTVDLQVIGQRHQDIKNGMTVPPEWTLSKLADFASKPAWVAGVLRGKRRTFGNIVGHIKNADNVEQLSQWTASQFDTTLNWKDVDWIRSIWPGKLILKGILDVEDAEEAVKSGAQALVVSNHGGRQLDGAPSSIEVLPEIVEAVGSKMEVLFDGGIRSGQDVMRALALGAKSCMIGRAFVYGLGAGGKAGVEKALDILRNELTVTMGLCGVNTIAEIDDRVLAILARDDFLESSSRPIFLFEHDLRASALRLSDGKPVPTFPDHAPGVCRSGQTLKKVRSRPLLPPPARLTSHEPRHQPRGRARAASRASRDRYTKARSHPRHPAEDQRLQRQVDADGLDRLHQWRAAFGTAEDQQSGRPQRHPNRGGARGMIDMGKHRHAPGFDRDLEPADGLFRTKAAWYRRSVHRRPLSALPVVYSTCACTALPGCAAEPATMTR